VIRSGETWKERPATLRDLGVQLVKIHIPPPILMLLSATLMWALCRWLPMAHWIGRPWNRVGALPAAIGLAIIVAAIRRFRHARTTVNPMDPGKAPSS
jgi:hypothetical protein